MMFSHIPAGSPFHKTEVFSGIDSNRGHQKKETGIYHGKKE